MPICWCVLCCQLLLYDHCLQMLSACSNPSSVMRQQLAFEQQDTKGQTAHSKLSQGSRASKTLRSGNSKPRKGWMALF